jgi:hypothetical protein
MEPAPTNAWTRIALKQSTCAVTHEIDSYILLASGPPRQHIRER